MKKALIAAGGILLLFVVTNLQCLAEENVINGCVHDKNGKLRIVSDCNKCNRLENCISWNIEGPQGEVGPQGPEGSQGPEGPPGLSNYSRVSSSYNFFIIPEEQLQYTVECPAGSKVLGGGYQVNATNGPYFDLIDPFMNWPVTDSIWEVMVVNRGIATAEGVLEIWAVCATVQ